MGLNPYAGPLLPPESSVNRVIIRSSAAWSAPWDGRTAGELLSRAAWIQTITKAFPELEKSLDPIRKIDQPQLGQVAPILGDRIAAHIETLRSGSLASRLDRPDWDDEAWRFWATRRNIILGGGLMDTRLGRAAARHAAERLPIRIEVPPFARELAIRGVARTGGISDGKVLALDFGQTAIKRSQATLKQGQIVSFEPWSSLAVDREWTANEIYSQALEAAENFDGEVIRMSVASYITPDGGPIPYGFIGQLRQLGDDVRGLIESGMTDRLGRKVDLRLFHDGTAAALSFAGEPDTAVIVLGTALGVGVPPATADGLAIWGDDVEWKTWSPLP